MERTPRIESKEDDSMHKETYIVKRQTRCSKDEKDNKNHDLKDLKDNFHEKERQWSYWNSARQPRHNW